MWCSIFATALAHSFIHVQPCEIRYLHLTVGNTSDCLRPLFTPEFAFADSSESYFTAPTFYYYYWAGWLTRDLTNSVSRFFPLQIPAIGELRAKRQLATFSVNHQQTSSAPGFPSDPTLQSPVARIAEIWGNWSSSWKPTFLSRFLKTNISGSTIKC